MKIFLLIQIIYVWSKCIGLVLKEEKKQEVFPVYAEPVGRESRKLEDKFNHTNHIINFGKNNRNDVSVPRNDTFEIIVGSKYRVANDGRSNFVTGRADTGFHVSYDNETFLTDKLIIQEYNKCAQSNGFSDCFKFKTLKFLQDLVVPIQAENLSEVIKSNAIYHDTEPLLIGLPPSSHETSTDLTVGIARSYGSSLGEITQFLLEQLDRFILRHGVFIPVNEIQNDQPFQQENPYLIRLHKNERAKRSSSAKLKKKELAIVFPLLVLFKFFKIKMLLLPIFLTVLGIKKLLIIAFTLAPNVLGLFRLCRPVPPFPPLGFQTAGFLQEVDTRGEFSTNTGYATPYRDQIYRQRDKTRPLDAAYGDY